MAYSTSLKEIAQAILAILDEDTTLGLRANYLGHTSKIPTYPATTVQAIDIDREIGGTHKFKLEFAHEVLIHYCKVGSREDNEAAILQLIDDVTALLATDRTLGGKVIFSLVSNAKVVDIARGSVMIRGALLSIASLSRETF